jgi:hypothetical protein
MVDLYSLSLLESLNKHTLVQLSSHYADVAYQYIYVFY